jgi:GGDEF domain-containing protein
MEIWAIGECRRVREADLADLRTAITRIPDRQGGDAGGAEAAGKCRKQYSAKQCIRLLMMDIIDREFAGAEKQVVLICTDLNNGKGINDTPGHRGGDKRSPPPRLS